MSMSALSSIVAANRTLAVCPMKDNCGSVLTFLAFVLLGHEEEE